MELLLEQGVDGIFTNHPDILRATIDARGGGTTPAQRGNPADFPRGCPGVAGRVTSNQGPGDVWEPVEGRGVKLKTPAAGTAARSGRFGGGFGLAALTAMLAGLWLRRQRH